MDKINSYMDKQPMPGIFEKAVHHAPNTGGLLPNDYTEFSAWIDYWKSFNSISELKKNGYYTCPDCGKMISESEFDGAHVQIKGKTKLYIVPTCSSCNKKKETEHLFIVKEQWLVPMPEKKK